MEESVKDEQERLKKIANKEKPVLPPSAVPQQKVAPNSESYKQQVQTSNSKAGHMSSNDCMLLSNNFLHFRGY